MAPFFFASHDKRNNRNENMCWFQRTFGNLQPDDELIAIRVMK
jgi:hypothetical protein